MSVTDVEQAALALPEPELVELVDRLYRRINFPADQAAAQRIQLADERELASEQNPNGDSPYEDFIDDLRKSL
jgi:hypothetical protein